MFNILDRVNRRQFIKKTAIGIFLAGGALTAGKVLLSPPDIELPDPYPELPDQQPVIPSYNKNALFFNEYQYSLVATLAAIIMPTDHDPGATEAGVVDYIDSLVAESGKNQSIYHKGLKWIDAACQKKYGSGQVFLNLSVKRQIDFLRLMQETDFICNRDVSGFLQRLNRKIDKLWENTFGIGEKARFFNVIRADVCNGYFSSPVSWKVVGYYGPPQPNGYLDFSEPPSSAKYTGSIRPVDNPTCLVCHEEGTHPRGGMINHTCTTCHRPHTPWPDQKDAFHLEDHAEFIFPSPDRKRID